MSTSEERATQAGFFAVGVAIAPLPGSNTAAAGNHGMPAEGTIPGYDDTFGRGVHARQAGYIQRGEEAVRAATEAIAGQIGTAAQHIATVIDQRVTPAPGRGLELGEIEVTFGVCLAAGVQALFTTQAESSVQVTIRLSRQDVSQSDGS